MNFQSADVRWDHQPTPMAKMRCIDVSATIGFPLMHPPKFSRMKDVLADVAEKHGLSVQQLRGKTRKRNIAWARQEAMWRIRQIKNDDGTPRYSLPQIGAYCGGRDHTTVIHALRRHEDRMTWTESEWPRSMRLSTGNVSYPQAL